MKKVGIITTGQSPRHEYRSFHRNALAALGIEVEVSEEAVLDGLSRDEIRQHEISPSDGLGIGCYVHSDVPADRRMGSGWEEIFVAQDWYLARAQEAVDRHAANGVDLILMCCAEMYPAGSITSTVPILLPYQLMFDVVRRRVETMGKTRLALLLPTPWHIDQDRATWQSQDWMKDVSVDMGVGIADGAGVEALKDKAPYDLCFIWGYGDGLAPHDPDNLVDDAAAALGCPVITPNILNVFNARMLLTPAWPERLHAEHVK